MAGGLRLLDMRFTGYSLEDVQDFRTAIGHEGTALYLGPQMWIDMIFPPLLGAVLFMIFRWLFPGSPRLIIGGLSQGYSVVDLLENLAIIAFLRAGVDAMTPEMAATANQWTTAKWSLAAAGLVFLIFGIGLGLRRRLTRS